MEDGKIEAFDGMFRNLKITRLCGFDFICKQETEWKL